MSASEWLIATEYNPYEVDLSKNQIRKAAQYVAFAAGAVNIDARTRSTVHYATHQWHLLNPSADCANPHDVVAILLEAEVQSERIRRFLGIPAAVR